MRKVHLITFGCQMNKLDSELASEAILDAGHAITGDEAEADVVIFNTCSVRDHAEQRVLSRLAQLRSRRESEPGFRLGLMGCFAEREGVRLLESLPYLDFAVGSRRFPELPRILDELDGADRPGLFGEGNPDSPGLGGAHPRGRHRGRHGFVSVMRGCGNRCSYCIVPEVRGGGISRPPGEIAAEVRALVRGGASEITLLGQNIDAYGRGGGDGLAGLLRRLDREIPEEDGLLRLRFVTSHPRDLTRELAEAVADIPRAARHFHMPAQSGSDAVLARMRRGYRRSDYDARLAMLADAVPEALVASDFIVGFPGETEADFLATLDLLEKARFQNSYIFRYSPRPGTPAARELADDVPDAEKRRRQRELLAAQERVGLERGRRLVGTRLSVLAEGASPRDPGRWLGRTGGNLICLFPSPPPGEDWTGRRLELVVESATALTLRCRVGGGDPGDPAEKERSAVS